ncbi:MAG TPA: hypothetical protein VGQ43_09840 [Candidatus Udaeobacter sp.]|jgi:hypothetical protein|nr:hypothetical protein [Candidatus Udaeobacter sp.]
MPNSTTCKCKKNIDRAAKQGMDRIKKVLKAPKTKDLKLDLEAINQILKNIKMDDHSGSRGFHHTGF